MGAPHIQPLGRQEATTLLGTLIGLRASYAWRGYGTALFLEFGRLRRTSRLHHPVGEAGAMVEWSWRVERQRSIAFGSWSSDRQIDAGIERLAGPHVTDVTITGRLPELVIALSDRRWVHTFMTAKGAPAWTVFLHDGSWVNFEGGRLVHNTQNRLRPGQHRVASA